MNFAKEVGFNSDVIFGGVGVVFGFLTLDMLGF